MPQFLLPQSLARGVLGNALPGLVLCVCIAMGSSALAQLTLPPMRHGVVFFCPDKTEEAIRQLELIQRDGFDLVKFASWMWTLPKPGSEMERRVQAVVDWCDRNNMTFFLLHNVQYGSAGEGGGLNDQVLHPEKSLPLLEDWTRVLRCHRCVMGVILGNEVGPTLGTPETAPLLWEEFRAWLVQQHRSIETLNNAWGSNYGSFEEVGVPQKDSPGWVDCRRYARARFALFYGTLIQKGLRPRLGDKLYGSKTSLDPFLHRACREMTMTCWDDMVSQQPLWEIKCAADTSGKPLFNAELHLYHDDYAYGPSPEQSRYRYFTSALLGEYLTASFAWGQWNKPESQRIHSATPMILACLRRLEKPCRLLSQAGQRSQLMVLVTEDNYYRPRIEEEPNHPLALLYAHMNALGQPWRYVLETDLARVQRGTMVVWTRGLNRETAQRLAALPKAVRVIAMEAAPERDEYGRLLPEAVRQRLKQRLRVSRLEALSERIPPPSDLPKEYRRVGLVSYLWWSEKRGNFHYSVPYCLLEVSRATTPEGTLVAVINNSRESQSAPLPCSGRTKVIDLNNHRELPFEQTRSVTFRPLKVRLFLLRSPGDSRR